MKKNQQRGTKDSNLKSLKFKLNPMIVAMKASEKAPILTLKVSHSSKSITMVSKRAKKKRNDNRYKRLLKERTNPEVFF